jgi:hypothetical protein
MTFSHKPVVRLFVAAIITHLAAIAPAYSGCHGIGPLSSVSPAESIAENRFICNATVFPARFKWRGRDMQVRNAWVERAFQDNLLCFCIDFYQDGQRIDWREHSLRMVINDYPQLKYNKWGSTEVTTAKQDLSYELFGVPGGKTYEVFSSQPPLADGFKIAVFGRVCTFVRAHDYFDNRLIPTNLTLELESERPISVSELRCRRSDTTGRDQ